MDGEDRHIQIFCIMGIFCIISYDIKALQAEYEAAGDKQTYYGGNEI